MVAVRAFVAALALLAVPSNAESRERNPLRQIGRIRRPTTHTPSNRVHSLSSFDLSFSLESPDAFEHERIRLVLSPNHNIIADNAVIQHLNPDGTIKRIEPIERQDHRVFRGDAFVREDGVGDWTNAGWARIMMHRDGEDPIFEGVFTVMGDHHHIQTDSSYRRTRLAEDPDIEEGTANEYMVYWRDSDIKSDFESLDGGDDLRRRRAAPTSCTSDALTFNSDELHPVLRSLDVREDEAARSFWSLSPRAIFGRDIDGQTGGNGAGVNLTSTIGSTNGCPNARKVALVGLATDCTYAGQFNSSETMRQSIISMVNSASQVYESTFNISLGIQNLTVTDKECPGSAPAATPWNLPCGSHNITERLNLFSGWRGQFNDTNAYWTLLSTCPSDGAVGLAWLGQACVGGSVTSMTSGGNETVASANVVVHTSTEWQIFAHESGHTFGAQHDCVQQTCSDGTATKQQCCPFSATTCDANGQFIMNPSTGSGITRFSPCSVGNICSAIGRNSVKTQCLTNNRDVTTINGQQCGNGIVEPGEDCDCGGPSGCGNNPCCNPTTCKFTTNSLCDPSNEECCTSTCQLASNGTVCRASTGTCDPAETCSGKSASCPADVLAPDGTSCGAGGAGLSCASGQCTSRNLQCKTLMGSLTTNNDTYACGSSGCQLSCASPEFGTNTCYTMQQNFLDGTPCEGGGTCSNGQCNGASVANEIGSWITDNKNIVIPVACVVGGLIILAIATCCINCFRRRRRGGRRSRPPPRQQPPPGWANGNPNALRPGEGPPPPQWRSDWPPPPPQMTPASRGAIYPPPARSMSVRYA